jgi:hypothetical protein
MGGAFRSVAARLSQPRMRRRVLTMSDQAVSSLSNILAAVLVARAFDSPEPFGAFGLAIVVYQLVLGVNRALVGEPLLSLYSHRDAAERDRVVPDLHGTSLGIALVASAGLAAISAALGGMAVSALLALAWVLPLLLGRGRAVQLVVSLRVNREAVRPQAVPERLPAVVRARHTDLRVHERPAQVAPDRGDLAARPDGERRRGVAPLPHRALDLVGVVDAVVG